MPPGVINSSVSGGASLNHSTVVSAMNEMRGCVPLGFFRKPRGSRVKRLPLRYARVWHRRWNTESVLENVCDEPVGIVHIRDMPQNSSWIKIGWKWIPHASGELGKDTAYLEFISKPEYETDLAFGLFKKLRVTYRPVRTFINRHRGWNKIATLFATVSCFQIVANSKEPWDSWFIIGSLMTIYACVSMLWIFYTAKGRGKK